MADKLNQCVIADDVRSARELLGSWMRELGFHCILVGDGKEALTAIEASLPDLVITDIEMPRCNGLELLNNIRDNDHSAIRTIPVVVVSSLEDGLLVDLATGLGASCVIGKPLEKSRIIDLVEALLRGAHSLQDFSHAEPFNEGPLAAAVSPKFRRMVDLISADCRRANGAAED